MFRCSLAFLSLAVTWCLGSSLVLPTVCPAQVDDAGIKVGTIDAETRWAFRTLKSVTVATPIVRLGDVVRPLDPNMIGWQRLRRSPIALVPLGGKSMTIPRVRLARAIRDADATPRYIDWIGPTEIEVTYRQDVSPPIALNAATPIGAVDNRGGSHPVTPLSHSTVAPGDSNQIAPVSFQSETASTDFVPLTANESKRILHWIMQTVPREAPELSELYRIKIDPKQAGMSNLRRISGVTTVRPNSEIREGSCLLRVVGRSIDGPIESDVLVTLEKHPTVAVSEKSLPRGHRIEPGDLITVSMPAEKVDSGVVLDPEAVIGLEVQGVLRAGQPIRRSDLGEPTLIHRGDLIDVMVVGGGVTVTAKAKSLSDGSRGSLVEVETIQIRKRLVARVVDSETVEIVTRAPQVRR